MKRTLRLSLMELRELHAILRRAAERAERNKRIDDAQKLAEEVINLEYEIKRFG